ncbi:uncharacterized protein LOC113868147 [Abrus precatorius]|uniref:Uncharacterized protein LOC113868147 n=1 Tax=Abrus precatorius TaxID=3816 RepID=A0A8B8LT05_ABRPR|nr:uncharacterized protein LOC113868147 [Abrus precatorius]
MCSCMPCFPFETSSSWWQRVRSPANKERWWMKVREWSEIVAGRKWKTFIRRFRNNGRARAAQHGSFRYDPLSYALNFDDGIAAGDDGYGYGGFSTRFASVTAPAKASADKAKEAPVLT